VNGLVDRELQRIHAVGTVVDALFDVVFALDLVAILRIERVGRGDELALEHGVRMDPAALFHPVAQPKVQLRAEVVVVLAVGFARAVARDRDHFLFDTPQLVKSACANTDRIDVHNRALVDPGAQRADHFEHGAGELDAVDASQHRRR
jgi:hypothetical protein